MSGKGTGAVSAKAVQKTVSQKTVSQKAVSHTVSTAESSARWAALDSRYERLVTASDALLADPDRRSDLKVAS